MKNIPGFYERSGDWMLNLPNAASNVQGSTYEDKPVSNTAARNVLITLIQRFLNSIKEQEGRIKL